VFKSVIFDLDGTLLDTISDLGYSINIALEAKGLTPLDPEKFPGIVGYGAKNLCERAYELSLLESGRSALRLNGTAGYEEIINDLLADFRKNYAENIDIRTVPYEGIVDVINLLREKDIMLNVLSNKPQKFTEKLVSDHFGDGIFRCVFGENDRFPKKPDPSCALYILKENGVTPEEAVFIGDGDSDIQTASSACIKAFAVLWGYRTAADLAGSGAKWFLSSPPEIIKAVTEDFMYN